MTWPPLLVLTDRRQLPPGRELVETISRCADAGLDTVVLRELDLTEAARAALSSALAGHVRVISARTLLPGASGVHLAASQCGLEARGIPAHGRSCHDADEVWRAVAAGADYVTLSPVASSLSKPGYGPALPTPVLRRAAELAHSGRPAQLYALGGVDAGNAAELRAAGADGLAVMGAVMRAEHPADVVARLLEGAS
jgi:thiamine-phosphate pyrophosphorylase